MSIDTSIKKTQIFKHLNFLIVATNSDESKEAEELRKQLYENDCLHCEIYHAYKLEYKIPQHINVKKWLIRQDFNKHEVHIVVSKTSNFELYPLFEYELLIPVVTPDWIQLCIQSNRHLRTSNFSPNPRLVFKNFQMLVSKNVFNHSEYFLFSEIIHCLGGTTVDYITKATTHIITTSPKDPAIIAMEKYKSSRAEPSQEANIQYVLPTWLCQVYMERHLVSIKEHLIDHRRSEMETREQLNELWDDIHNFEELFDGKRDKIFMGKSFEIGDDIDLNRKSYRYFCDMIKSLGGQIILSEEEKNAEAEDSGTGQSRTSADFIIRNTISDSDTGANKRTLFGNIFWIVNIWNREKFFLPDTNAICLPRRRRKLFRKQDLAVTYTNYFGEQRTYLQQLIELLGGSATMELSKQNTHLICNLPFGKKYEVAMKWKESGSKIVICSHRWLEECYISGKKVPVDEAYTRLERDDNTYSLTLGQQLSPKLDSENSSDEETDIEESQVFALEYLKTSQSRAHDLTGLDDISHLESSIRKKKYGKSNANENASISRTPSASISNDSSRDDEAYETAPTNFLTSTELNKSAKLDKQLLITSTVDPSNLRLKDTDYAGSALCLDEDKHESNKTDAKLNIEGHVALKNGAKRTSDVSSTNKVSAGNSDKNAKLSYNKTDEYSSIRESESSYKQLENMHNKSSNGMVSTNQSSPNNTQLNTDENLTTNNSDNHKGNIIVQKNTEDNGGMQEDSTSTTMTDKSALQDEMMDNEHDVHKETMDLIQELSGGRKAKTKAARRLHEDIESLNEHEKNSGKRRKVRDKNGSLLLPEEIKQLQEQEILIQQAKKTLFANPYTCNSSNQTISLNIGLNAICTGFSLEDLTDIEKEILRLVGIKLQHDNVDQHIFEEQRGQRGHNRINTIFAPKRLRTVKFLKSLSLSSIRYFLTPDYITALLLDIKSGKDVSKYRSPSNSFRIDSIDDELIEKMQKVSGKLFFKSKIKNVNIMHDLKASPKVVGEILKCHGVDSFTILKKQYVLTDIARNTRVSTDNTVDYILIASSKNQVTKFKKLIQQETNSENVSVLVVNWDWCVDCIFNAEVNLEDKANIFFNKRI